MTKKRTPETPAEPRKLNAAELGALEMVYGRLASAKAYLMALEIQDDPVLMAQTETARANLKRRIGEMQAQEAAYKVACGIPAEAQYMFRNGELAVMNQGKFGGITGGPVNREEMLRRRDEAIANMQRVEHPVPEGKFVPPVREPAPATPETPKAAD